MDRFKDKVAIVTGAGGGIGRACAIRLASEGATIVAVDVSDEALAETVAHVEKTGVAAVPFRADVTRSAEVEAYVQTATEKCGGVDILINNAGIEGVVAPLDQYPEDMFDKVLGVNVMGVWFGMRHVADAMRKRGGGAIVNMASVAGLTGTPNMIAYGASKHAVIGMTKTAAFELASASIRVNAVCPGVIATRMMDSIAAGSAPQAPERYRDALNKRVPQGRYGEPEEVAGVVAFLASDDARYINGSAYTIDGGLQSA